MVTITEPLNEFVGANLITLFEALHQMLPKPSDIGGNHCLLVREDGTIVFWIWYTSIEDGKGHAREISLDSADLKKPTSDLLQEIVDYLKTV